MLTSPILALQVEPAVDDRPSLEVRRQKLRRNDSRVAHVTRDLESGSLPVPFQPNLRQDRRRLLHGTPKMLLYIGVAILVVAGLILLMVRRGIQSDTLDLGAVSTRWLSELRRDEPWTRS